MHIGKVFALMGTAAFGARERRHCNGARGQQHVAQVEPFDTAKIEGLLKTGTALVPRETFMAAMADNLFHFSQLYARNKLDEPQKMDALIQRAQSALTGLPETKEIQDLKSDIEAAVKKAKTKK